MLLLQIMFTKERACCITSIEVHKPFKQNQSLAMAQEMDQEAVDLTSSLQVYLCKEDLKYLGVVMSLGEKRYL